MIGVGVKNAYISRWVSFRTLCYTAVFSLITLVFLAFNPAVNIVSRAEDEIEPVTEMILTSGDLAVELEMMNPSGTFVTSDTADITVTTNNYTGYTLRIRANEGEDETKLVSGENAIESISAASTADEFGSQNWGILPSKYNSLDNDLYQPAPTSEGAILDTTDAPNEEANIYTLAFGVKVDGLLPEGTYSNTFVIEASGNPASYTINYDDGASEAIINVPDDEWGSSTEAEIYISDQVPERTGYDYVAWCSGNVTTTVGVDSCDAITYQPGDAIRLSKLHSNDLALKSMWIPITYSISYNLNGGSATNPTSYNIVSDNITLTNPTKNRYTFTGWTGSNGSTAQTTVTIPQGSISDRTYTANWTPTNYTISYNLDGGSATNPTSYNIETNTITLNNPSKTGYTFKGWSGTGLTGDTNKTVTIAIGSTGNRSYTANWTINTYTVTCEDWFVDASNNGKVKLGSSTKTYNYGATASGADWGSDGSTNKYYSGYAYKSATSSTVPANNNLVVYRRFHAWTDLNIYYAGSTTQGGATVALSTNNSNYTDVTNESNTVQPYGTTYYIKNIRPKNSYESLDRVQNLTYNSVGYYYYTPTTGGTSMNIYMKFTAYSISYNLNGGSVSGNPTSYNYSTAAFTLNNPTKTGNTFAGWTGTGLSAASTSVTVPTHSTGNRSYTANWTVNKYYLDLNGLLDGTASGNISGFGTADVYVNGTLVANDVTDYYAQHPYGSTYQITDIKAASGKTYNGVSSGAASGTIGAGNVGVQLKFTTNPCTFTSKDFGYTGGVQSWTVPTGCGGNYKLEVWGAQGGANESRAGGAGGYATGTVSLTGGTTVYVVVGGQGVSKGAGGYNGGGAGGSDEGAGGGGATHIGKTNALLRNTASGNLYIVAGGGGGGSKNGPGGAGGGSTGGTGYNKDGTTSGGGTGGSQTAAGCYPGVGYCGGYGYGGAPESAWEGGGGGGGYYGGGGGGNWNGGCGGGGGSGYTGGVSGGSMSNGQRSGNGYARITKQ